MEKIINYRRLNDEAPQWKELELGYRTKPERQRSETAQAILTLTVLSLGAFLAMLFVRVFGAQFFQPQGIIFCSVVSAFVAFVIVARNRTAYRWALLVAFSGPFVSLFIGALHHATASASSSIFLTLLAVALCTWLVDLLTRHYASWLLANPRLSRPVRLARLKWYECRWFHPMPDGPEPPTPQLARLRNAEMRRVRFYPLGFATVATLYVILPLLENGGDPPDEWIFFVPPACALVALWWTAPQKRLFAAFRTSLKALTSWFTYGQRGIEAPGVFRSPAGSLTRRTWLTTLVFSITALSVAPYVQYFSFVQSFTGDHPVWQQQFADSLNQNHSLVSIALSAAGSFQPSPLTPDEHAVLQEYRSRLRAIVEGDSLALVRDPVPSLPDSRLGPGLGQDPDEWRKKLLQKQSTGQRSGRGIGQDPDDWREELQEKQSSWELQTYYAFTNARPHAWVLIAMDAVSRGETQFLYPLVFGFLACLGFPLLVLWTFLASASAGVLTHTRLAVEEPEAPECCPPDAKPAPDWENYVSRLRSSQTKRESEHLWLGAHAHDDYPILLDREILSQHAYIVGDSGSGKTALGIMPMLVQLIRAKHGAVVVLDLKGDNALFQTVREEARAAGTKFRFFTNELGKPTYTFNPFLQANPEHISLNQVCETMLEALNLNHGEGYGRSYYSRVARRWLSAILKSYPFVESFDKLYELAQAKENFRDEKERQDAFELIAVIESLASFQQLNITPTLSADSARVAKHAIHMPDVIANREVVYFWLPAAIETASVREIAKLALYSLLNSAYWHVRNDGQPGRIYLVIDEFQRIASENFKIVLEQARSMGVGAILANQTFSDLKTNDTDLRPTVQTNTRFKQVFSATDLEQQETIMAASGERIDLRYSWTTSDRETSTTASQTIVPRLMRNDIIEMSDEPLGSIIQVSRGHGFTQFSGYSVPARSGYCMTKDEYDKRAEMPWPEASLETITVTREPLQPDSYPNAERRLEAGRVILDTATKPKGTAFEPIASSPTSKVPQGVDWAARLEALVEAQHKRMKSARFLQEPDPFTP